MKALCQQGSWGVGGEASACGAVSGLDLTPNCFSLEDDQGGGGGGGVGGTLLTKLKAFQVGVSFD